MPKASNYLICFNMSHIYFKICQNRQIYRRLSADGLLWRFLHERWLWQIFHKSFFYFFGFTGFIEKTEICNPIKLKMCIKNSNNIPLKLVSTTYIPRLKCGPRKFWIWPEMPKIVYMNLLTWLRYPLNGW